MTIAKKSNIIISKNKEYNKQDSAESSFEDTKWIKIGIWLYFFLLIFEGALRKWFLPSLSVPLLVIRDPITIGLIFITWKKGLFPKSIYLSAMLFIGILSIITTLIFGHGSIPVTLFGARVLLLHFPLIFIIGRIFTFQDVIKMAKVTLWISIPMALLITLQFYSPQSAWVNRGIGGDIEGAGFSGALGYFRPPGTFSFTNGNTLFFSFSAVCILYFWLKPKIINRYLLISASIALLISIPFSVSRYLFFAIIIHSLFAFSIVAKNPKYLYKIIIGCIGIGLLFFLFNQLGIFQTATDVFYSRFESASSSEGGLEGTLYGRFIYDGLLKPFIEIGNQPFFGYGLGMGTQAGAKLLTGERGFVISEGEWGRIIGEMGLLLGATMIFIRVGLTLSLVFNSFKSLANNKILPWILSSNCILMIVFAQWGQPTALGFAVIIGGILMASLNSNIDDYNLLNDIE